jgi:hypothetical protein
MGIFYRWRGHFPGTALDKVAPQRLAASDEAVMSVRKGEHGQEGNRLATNIAEPTPNPNPVVVFVMSLFLAAAMTYDRIATTNGAPARDAFCAGLRPIGFRLALRRAKCDKDNRGNGGSAWDDLAEIVTPSGAFLLPKTSTGKEYRILATPAISNKRAPGIGRLTSKEIRLAGAPDSCPIDAAKPDWLGKESVTSRFRSLRRRADGFGKR